MVKPPWPRYAIVTFEHERIRCGKPRCGKCPHGPYWYGYWHDATGKLRKAYVGKDRSRFEATVSRSTLPKRSSSSSTLPKTPELGICHVCGWPDRPRTKDQKRARKNPARWPHTCTRTGVRTRDDKTRNDYLRESAAVRGLGSRKRTEPPSRSELVMQIVRANVKRNVGLAYVPDLVRADVSHADLARLYQAGKIELRPWAPGALERVPKQDERLMMPGPEKSLLAWVRVR